MQDMIFPAAIRQITGDRPYYVDRVGMSTARVICFEDMVLKIEKSGEESDNEQRMMAWLKGKLPVPEILCAEKENGINYLLMSRLDGVMSCSEEYIKKSGELIRLLAEGMKMLWSVDITDCPYCNDTENKLRQAKQQIENGICDMENVEEGTYGENGFAGPKDLLEWLQDHKPKEELVFSHGDYCLPNVLFKDGRVCGFLDLGGCGIADKYQDIALCYRSLIHNYSGKYGGKVYGNFDADLLFQELGIEPDWEKIKYYILLDELF